MRLGHREKMSRYLDLSHSSSVQNLIGRTVYSSNKNRKGKVKGVFFSKNKYLIKVKWDDGFETLADLDNVSELPYK